MSLGITGWWPHRSLPSHYILPRLLTVNFERYDTQYQGKTTGIKCRAANSVKQPTWSKVWQLVYPWELQIRLFQIQWSHQPSLDVPGLPKGEEFYQLSSVWPRIVTQTKPDSCHLRAGVWNLWWKWILLKSEFFQVTSVAWTLYRTRSWKFLSARQGLQFIRIHIENDG